MKKPKLKKLVEKRKHKSYIIEDDHIKRIKYKELCMKYYWKTLKMKCINERDEVVERKAAGKAILEEKMKIHISKSDIFRGYTPLGEELTNDKYDWHECVDFGPSSNISKKNNIKKLVGPNQWPENQNKFKMVLEKHYDLMNSLGKRITQGLSISLGLSKNYFLPFMNKSHSYMRISNYPPIENKKKDSEIGEEIIENKKKD